MHELSLARMLVRLVHAHVPADVKVRVVRVRAGAAQAIEPAAMQLAWRAATWRDRLEGASLEFAVHPWVLTCATCGCRWESKDPFERCACGGVEVAAEGGSELVLVSVDAAEWADGAGEHLSQERGDEGADRRERVEAE